SHASSGPLNPGVYCGGVTISKSETFNPGVYVMKNGDLHVTGTGVNINAAGVTFILQGNGSGVTIQADGNMTFSPASNAGPFDGFVFFLDQNASYNPLNASYIEGKSSAGAQVTITGTIYLNGQQLIVGKGSNDGSNITMTGSIIAGFLLPQGANFNFTGQVA